MLFFGFGGRKKNVIFVAKYYHSRDYNFQFFKLLLRIFTWVANLRKKNQLENIGTEHTKSIYQRLYHVKKTVPTTVSRAFHMQITIFIVHSNYVHSKCMQWIWFHQLNEWTKEEVKKYCLLKDAQITEKRQCIKMLSKLKRSLKFKMKSFLYRCYKNWQVLYTREVISALFL